MTVTRSSAPIAGRNATRRTNVGSSNVSSPLPQQKTRRRRTRPRPQLTSQQRPQPTFAMRRPPARMSFASAVYVADAVRNRADPMRWIVSRRASRPSLSLFTHLLGLSSRAPCLADEDKLSPRQVAPTSFIKVRRCRPLAYMGHYSSGCGFLGYAP